MAIGNVTDFVIYQEQFFSGMTEVLQQNTDAFNAASQNALRLVTLAKKGDYEQASFIETIANLSIRRDNDVTTGVDDKPMTMEENISVKLNRRIGPVATTNDQWRKAGSNPAVFSFLLGQQAGKAVLVDQVNATLMAGEAAISNVAALNHDGTAAVIDQSGLVSAMSKLGDAGQRLVCWVMHSKPYYDLMAHYATENIFGVSDVTITKASVPTLGKPTIVIDSPSLVVAGTTPNYITLGLVTDGLVACESEERDIVTQPVTGLENLVTRIQGEYCFNVGAKGFKYLMTSGKNPDDATLGTGSNWPQVATDIKDCAGVRLTTL